MRKTHFTIRLRVNRAAHRQAHTAVFILLVDPPDPVQTLVFRNDTPDGLPRSLELRTLRPIEAVKVDILSDPRIKDVYPAIWIEADWDEHHRRCRVCADTEGHIRHREVFTAEDTPPL